MNVSQPDTHNIAVFFVLVAQLAFAFHWMVSAGKRVRLANAWLAANGVVFVLWLPWLYIILTELLGNDSLAWLSHYTAVRALDDWHMVQGFALSEVDSPWAGRIAGVLCMIGTVRIAKTTRGACCLAAGQRPRSVADLVDRVPPSAVHG